MEASDCRGAPKKFKVVVLGGELAGKTSLVCRYVDDTFEEHPPSTIGVNLHSKTAYLEDGRSLRLQLWDTAGQERYHSLIPSYIRDAAAAVVVYDITSQSSFQKTRSWVAFARAERGNEAVLALVGNKSDLGLGSPGFRARGRQRAGQGAGFDVHGDKCKTRRECHNALPAIGLSPSWQGRETSGTARWDWFPATWPGTPTRSWDQEEKTVQVLACCCWDKTYRICMYLYISWTVV